MRVEQAACVRAGDVRAFRGVPAGGTAESPRTRRDPAQQRAARASDRGTCARFAGFAPAELRDSRARGEIPRSRSPRMRRIGGRGRESAGRGARGEAMRAHDARSRAIPARPPSPALSRPEPAPREAGALRAGHSLRFCRKGTVPFLHHGASPLRCVLVTEAGPGAEKKAGARQRAPAS